MQLPIETMESRENMILKMFRKSNAAILAFVMGIKLRSVGATILGGFAGLSLTATIIPSAMSLAGVMDSFSARWAMGGYAVYSTLAWAVGGWAVQKTGDKRLGSIVLGTVGLSSGLLFSGAGIGTEPLVLMTGGGAALLYGAIGGMIIGDALRNPPSRDSAAPQGHEGRKKQDPVRLFRFFK